MVEQKRNFLVRELTNFVKDLKTDLEIIKGDTVRAETQDGVINGVILEDGRVFYADGCHIRQPYQIKEGDIIRTTPSLFHTLRRLLT